MLGRDAVDVEDVVEEVCLFAFVELPGRAVGVELGQVVEVGGFADFAGFRGSCFGFVARPLA